MVTSAISPLTEPSEVSARTPTGAFQLTAGSRAAIGSKTQSM
jgi:hypothetical protein